jgi:hypothetical protein
VNCFSGQKGYYTFGVMVEKWSTARMIFSFNGGNANENVTGQILRSCILNAGPLTHWPLGLSTKSTFSGPTPVTVPSPPRPQRVQRNQHFNNNPHFHKLIILTRERRKNYLQLPFRPCSHLTDGCAPPDVGHPIFIRNFEIKSVRAMSR